MLAAAGKADIAKIRPIVFSPDVARYHSIGEFVAKAFEIGKKYEIPEA